MNVERLLLTKSFLEDGYALQALGREMQMLFVNTFVLHFLLLVYVL